MLLNWWINKYNLHCKTTRIIKNDSFRYRVTDEEGTYKPVPAPKPVPNNQRNQTSQLNNELTSSRHHQQHDQPIVGTTSPTVIYSNTRNSGQFDNNESRTTTIDRDSGQTGPGPEYRMPPLYGEEQTSNQNQPTNLQTHSNKFPVILFLTKFFIHYLQYWTAFQEPHFCFTLFNIKFNLK